MLQVSNRGSSGQRIIRILSWKDFYDGQHPVEFATFAPPGRYYVKKPWKNEYWGIAEFKKAILRDIQSPASEEVLQEIEMVFKDSKTAENLMFNL